MLRGPQTLGELKLRSERLHAFADLAAVEETLERLAAAGYAVRLARHAGAEGGAVGASAGGRGRGGGRGGDAGLLRPCPPLPLPPPLQTTFLTASRASKPSSSRSSAALEALRRDLGA